jgi:hypothetical protein
MFDIYLVAKGKNYQASHLLYLNVCAFINVGVL